MSKILMEDLTKMRDALKQHAEQTVKQYEAIQIVLDLIEGKPFGNSIGAAQTTALVRATPAPARPYNKGTRPRTWKHTREEVLEAALQLQQPTTKPQICEQLGTTGNDFPSIHAHVHELMTRGYAKRVAVGMYIFTRK